MRPMRMHHVGVVLPTVEQAERLIQLFGLKVDYRGYVKSYHADLIFTQYGPNESPIEFIIPHEGVLTKFNNGKGGIAHIAFEVEDVEAASRELEEQGLLPHGGAGPPRWAGLPADHRLPHHKQTGIPGG